MDVARQLVRILNRIMRDACGSSSMVERFDIIAALLYVTSRLHGARPDRDAFHAMAARMAREDPDLFPWPRGAVPLDDVTVDACLDAVWQHTPADPGADLPGAAYEELLRNTFDKGDNQQFFTPPPVVGIMVDLVADRLAGRICDPACGTGGLLVAALRAAREKGVDVELEGFEVDPRLARATRMNLALAGARRASVRSLDRAGSLAPGVVEEAGTFDLVLTNPPFGSDTTDSAALDSLVLGRGRGSRRRGVLFVERCLDLARPGATVCILVDDSITAGRSSADARALILERSVVRAVVSLPDTAFMPYASVRTSVMLLERRAPGRACSSQTSFSRVMDGRLGEDRQWDRQEFVTAIPDAGDPSFSSQGLRLDIDYHDPGRHAVHALLDGSPYDVVALSSLCDVRLQGVHPDRDIEEELFDFVGLSDMEPRTGRMSPRRIPTHEVKGPVLAYRSGDILYSRLRPALGKVCLVPGSMGPGYVSAECLVLVPRTDGEGRPLLLPRLMEWLLRSSLALDQVRSLVTGIGRPRLSRAAVMSIRLPVPPGDVQMRLLRSLDGELGRARQLRERARRTALEADVVESRALEALLEDLTAPGEDAPRPAAGALPATGRLR